MYSADEEQLIDMWRFEEAFPFGGWDMMHLDGRWQSEPLPWDYREEVLGYLTANDGKEYFPQVIVATLQGTLGAFENRMASLLFKMAVELSMSLHVTAAHSEIDEETLVKLRGLCVDEVKRIRGAVSFDEAYKFQKG